MAFIAKFNFNSRIKEFILNDFPQFGYSKSCKCTVSGLVSLGIKVGSILKTKLLRNYLLF